MGDEIEIEPEVEDLSGLTVDELASRCSQTLQQTQQLDAEDSKIHLDEWRKVVNEYGVLIEKAEAPECDKTKEDKAKFYANRALACYKVPSPASPST